MVYFKTGTYLDYTVAKSKEQQSGGKPDASQRCLYTRVSMTCDVDSRRRDIRARGKKSSRYPRSRWCGLGNVELIIWWVVHMKEVKNRSKLECCDDGKKE